MFTALNLSTAAAWIAYFFGLTHLEPAIVNTLYTGVGPLRIPRPLQDWLNWYLFAEFSIARPHLI